MQNDADFRLVIARARDNSTGGEERIADELLVQLGIQISPTTVGKYLREIGLTVEVDQRRAMFLRNTPRSIIAAIDGLFAEDSVLILEI